MWAVFFTKRIIACSAFDKFFVVITFSQLYCYAVIFGFQPSIITHTSNF